MKKFKVMAALALAVSMLAGCAGTPVVYYTECNCPQNNAGAVVENTVTALPEA